MTSTMSPRLQEKTFTAYNTTQSTTYSTHRLNYHPNVYNTILSHHTQTGGNLSTCLDVGCGPGLATRTLAAHFTTTTGVDPSPAMLATARTIPSDHQIEYLSGCAEDLSAIPSDSIDLLTAANAAHWFDMPAFWREAERVVKRGGSVALWTSGSIAVHPDLPDAEKIQAFWDEVEEKELERFFVEGNRIVRGNYRGLGMPWEGDDSVGGFKKEGLKRWDWGAGQKFFGDDAIMDLNAFEAVMGTSSPVTRWREAHPEKVGTEEDVVRILRRGVERLLWEAGVEKGSERVKGSVPGVIIMLKRT